jgi:hypothetical protein
MKGEDRMSETYEAPALVWLGPLGTHTEGLGPFQTFQAGGAGGPGGGGSLGGGGGGGAGGAGSDRAIKEAFTPVDPRTVLDSVRDLPIERWRYKGDGAAHIGPMAQDFAAAFGVGDDDRVIYTVDAQGVALAAIQALAAEVAELRAEVARLS